MSIVGIMVKEVYVFARLEPYVKETVKRRAKELGLSTSEYLRMLIIRDLDRRGILKKLQ